MPSDEQADLLVDLDTEDAEAILNEMTPEDAKDARELVQYDDDVAGGLMVREYLSFPEMVCAVTYYGKGGLTYSANCKD